MRQGWCPIQFSGWQHHTEGPLGTLGTVLPTLRLLVLQTVVSWYLLRSLDFIPAGTHTASLLLVSGAILKLSTRWQNFVFDLILFNRCPVNHVGCLLGGERRVHLHSSRWWRCDRVHEESKPCRVFWRLRLCLRSLVYGSTISNQSADHWNNIGNHKLYTF